MRHWAGDDVLSRRSQFDRQALGMVYAVLKLEWISLREIRAVLKQARRLGLMAEEAR